MTVVHAARAFCGAVALLFLLAQPSLAQTPAPDAARKLPVPVIAVVDFKRVVSESSAGQSVIKQINDRHAGFQKEIQAITAQLEQSRQELARQQSILAPDVFAQKRQEFQGRAQQYQRSVQDAQKKLDLMLRHSMRTVETELAKVVAAIATDLGANLVIDAGLGRGDVLFTDGSLVITAEAKARLNQVLPDVKVVEPKPQPAGANNGEQPKR
tara:strand:- start:527 stop:1162 length:636 start_codon:yes stop_codon:yes gene_type:complete